MRRGPPGRRRALSGPAGPADCASRPRERPAWASVSGLTPNLARTCAGVRKCRNNRLPGLDTASAYDRSVEPGSEPLTKLAGIGAIAAACPARPGLGLMLRDRSASPPSTPSTTTRTGAATRHPVRITRSHRPRRSRRSEPALKPDDTPRSTYRGQGRRSCSATASPKLSPRHQLASGVSERAKSASSSNESRAPAPLWRSHSSALSRSGRPARVANTGPTPA
jgi:hypothetical protein